VNVSVDSLDPRRAAAVARRDLGLDPLRALDAAERAGLTPLKVNVVVMRGVNSDEVEALAALSVDRPWHVRFIELMPVGELADSLMAEGRDPAELVVPSDEVLARVTAWGERFGRAAAPAAGPARGNGPARYVRLSGAAGTVGVISPMTHTYCGSCNRVRLTADGRLRPCLYDAGEVALRPALRAGAPLAPLVRQALAAKPAEHLLLQRRVGGLRALSEVGG
jgi:cyclic pyranopterin phosphate synthase